MCFLDGIRMKAACILVIVATVVSAEQTHHINKRSKSCILPPYPEHGAYEVTGSPSAQPGDHLDAASINVTCSQGYGVIGSNVFMCVHGEWSPKAMPQCVSFCHLPKHASVEYQCFVSGSGGSRICNEYEPSGTIVRPRCRSPNYYNPAVLAHMRCTDGYWDYLAVCSPECGRIPKTGEETGLPWHVTIYQRSDDTSRKICGGSIISNTIIVTAAHCFAINYTSRIRPSDFAVAVGNINKGVIENPPKILVKSIDIPLRFRGANTNFQDDIALITLNDPIEYSTHVRPVCLDFDINFERRQLQQGNLGTLFAWTDPKAEFSSLQLLELPYITNDQCLLQAPTDFKEYITSDKFCAGRNGTTICKGNSGSGLTFAEEARGVSRHYLRGIVSTSPNNQEVCYSTDLVTFTQISKQEYFIKKYLV